MLFQSLSSLNSTISDCSITESKTKDEKRTQGKTETPKGRTANSEVQGSILIKYLLAGGNVIIVCLMCSLFLTAQLFASLNDFFVSFWTNVEEHRNATSAEDHFTLSTENCVYIYSGLIGGLFIVAFTRSILFYKIAMNSSRNLHNSMFLSVVNAPLNFFDKTPSGAILNRFSKDIGNIDEPLPKSALDAGQVRQECFGYCVI